MVIMRNGPGLDTKVYVKTANAVADPGGGVRPLLLDQGQESDFLEFYRKGQVKVST